MTRKAGKGGEGKGAIKSLCLLARGMGENAFRAKGNEEEERGPPLFIALQEGLYVLLKDVLPFSFCSRKKTLCSGFCGGVLVCTLLVSGDVSHKCTSAQA